ncbi:MAG: glycosyltransferase family 4 protein [Pyrinomonadaceae bacterium]|nr:glycosyltransferase family 4 protein [Pyrinomonadaceae bacterium]
MQILQISSAKNIGGGEKHLVDLCRGLHRKGHKVFVALRKENEFEHMLGFLPVENRLHVRLRNALDVLSARKIARFLRENEIDIVHAHLARDYPPASMAVRLYPDSKLVITRHVLFPMKKLHKLVLKNVSKAIAVSTAVERNLEKTFPKEKVIGIPNGIDIERSAKINKNELSMEFRNEHSIPLNSKLIGTVGELIALKGQDDFVTAAAAITARISDVHFVIVGRDNSIDMGFKKRLEQLVESSNLNEKFSFIDWVDDTLPLLSALDVFVSSSHSESFGLAILEAMAAGTPIVSTETDGAKELLDDEITGLLARISDPSDLAEKVIAVLNDDQKRIEFATAAKGVAREDFSLQNMIDQTLKVYKDSLSM